VTVVVQLEQPQPHITYPLESLFVPLHLVIMGIIVMTVAIFIVFMRRFLKPKKLEEDSTAVRTGIISERRDWRTDLIALATIAISIVAVLFPFLQTPILDYVVSDGPKIDNMTETFEISITNYGNVVAKNVVISIMVADLHNFRFNNFISEPILPDTKSITNQTGRGLFEIKVLPPRSNTTVTAEYNFTKGDAPKIKTFVRSDETVGYHVTILTTVVYTTYVILLSFITTVLVKRIKWKWQYSTALSGGIILVSIVLALIIYQR
jgi:uncharacterized membrane protein (DUF485 family)